MVHSSKHPCSVCDMSALATTRPSGASCSKSLRVLALPRFLQCFFWHTYRSEVPHDASVRIGEKPHLDPRGGHRLHRQRHDRTHVPRLERAARRTQRREECDNARHGILHLVCARDADDDEIESKWTQRRQCSWLSRSAARRRMHVPSR